MFVAAFPLAPFIALVSNLIQIRIDAIKLIYYHKRPIALESSGIAVWHDILQILTTVSLVGQRVADNL